MNETFSRRKNYVINNTHSDVELRTYCSCVTCNGTDVCEKRTRSVRNIDNNNSRWVVISISNLFYICRLPSPLTQIFVTQYIVVLFTRTTSYVRNSIDLPSAVVRFSTRPRQNIDNTNN